MVILAQLITSSSSLHGLSSLARRTLHARTSTLLSRGGRLHGHLVGLVTLHALSTCTLVVCSINMVAAVIANERCQVLNSAGTGVVDWVVFGARSEELDSRETLDLVWNIIGSGINLGDDHFVGVSLIKRTELLVLGRKSLAVSAPRRVELEKDILLVVDDEILVVLRNDDSDGAVLLLGYGLGLDARLDLACNEILDEFSNGLLGESLDASLLAKWELLVLLGVLDRKGGPVADFQIEVASVLAERLGVDGGEVDSALVLLGDRLEVLGERLALFWSLREDVRKRDTGLDVLLLVI